LPFESVSQWSAVGHGENIKPLARAWGDPVTAVGRADSAGDNIELAGLYSTAPYIDPLLQRAAREAEEKAKTERIEVGRSNVAPANVIHCTHQGCRAPARRGTDYCRWHQPLIEAE
jgi:hypothetical protein